MKKLLAAVAALAVALSFTSCGKKINSADWISTLEDARTAAQKENKKIILCFTAADSDQISERLNDNIFFTEEFKTRYTPDYVLCNIDFSNSRFEENSPDADDASSKEAEARRNQLNIDMKNANIYGLQNLPAYFVTTKHGYVIGKLNLEEAADIDDFDNELASITDRASKVDDLLKTISTGKKAEVLAAINELYDSTEINYRMLLSDFNKQYVKLDKKDTTGNAVKHLFAWSEANAQYAILEQDYEKAVKELLMPADYSIVKDEDLQQVYYSAAYFMASSGSTDFAKIKDYLQKAVDAAPESENAESLKQAIQMVEAQQAQVEAAAAAQSEGPSPAPQTDAPVSDAPAAPEAPAPVPAN